MRLATEIEFAKDQPFLETPQMMQCPNSALTVHLQCLTVPLQCPYNALAMPLQCLYSALGFVPCKFTVKMPLLPYGT